MKFSGKNKPLICILLACLLTPAVHATPLGRLFFTAEQRTQLDRDHTRNPAIRGDNSPVLTVNGIVQKNGGARTAWINGVPQKVGKSDERNPEILPLAVPGKSQPVKIKVGQKLLLNKPVQQNPATPAD